MREDDHRPVGQRIRCHPMTVRFSHSSPDMCTHACDARNDLLLGTPKPNHVCTWVSKTQATPHAANAGQPTDEPTDGSASRSRSPLIARTSCARLPPGCVSSPLPRRHRAPLRRLAQATLQRPHLGSRLNASTGERHLRVQTNSPCEPSACLIFTVAVFGPMRSTTCQSFTTHHLYARDKDRADHLILVIRGVNIRWIPNYVLFTCRGLSTGPSLWGWRTLRISGVGIS